MDNKRLADNIKSLRNSNRITQKELADELGISVVSVQKYEEGARRPLLEGIEEMAKAFGVSPFSILNGVFDD